MATKAVKFTAEISGVGIRYVKKKDKDGKVTGSDAVCMVTLRNVSEDEHELADAVGEKIGHRVKVSLSLEQTELDES